MQPSREASHRGILRPHGAPFSLSRPGPAPDLAGFVERHWIVRWDLRGQAPYLSETLPHPSVHLVVEPHGAAVYGVPTQRWSRLLEGRGEAVGTKFLPGGFHPFTKAPVAELTDRILPLEDLFGPAGVALEERVRSADGDRQRVEAVTDFLRARRRRPDPNVATVQRVVRAMLEEPADARVEDLTGRLGLSARTLQRLFRRYVGVSPKWVLKRHRLHVAAERIADGERDLARLAHELGYFDQAHFIKDFGGLVGRSPAQYAAECERKAQVAA
jgi:AraC-like DNA-binding protein